MGYSNDYAKISGLCAKEETYEQLSQLGIVIINIICVCKEQTVLKMVEISLIYKLLFNIELLSLILVECFKNH